MRLDHPVQYFIPWRVVFKASSISTPARPVFDCSARTPINAEGKGGCCLNDLVKFSIGHAGISGDISQLYNVIKLKPEYWHLQLFL